MAQMVVCTSVVFGGLLLLILTLAILILRPNIPLTDDVTLMELKTNPPNKDFSSEPFPKTIHQIWLGYDTKEPPESWKNGTIISRLNNPDYSYRLWSKKDVVTFLATHYPWFLMTYYNYPYDVERADAARYFIIMHYGGIYLDMDEISRISITDIIAKNDLGAYDCVLPAGTPNGVTNYVLMCKQKSPFMTKLVAELSKRSGWYVAPYATVMWSTGPRFLSGVYDQYPDKASIYVMQEGDIKTNFECLFGQTWFRLDGIIVHAIVYPFVRLGISWTYLVLVVLICLVAIFAGCAWTIKNKRANEQLQHKIR